MSPKVTASMTAAASSFTAGDGASLAGSLGVDAVSGGVGLVKAAFWAVEEKKQQALKSDVKAHKKAAADPETAALLQQKESLSEQLRVTNLARVTISKQLAQGDPIQVERKQKELASLEAHVANLDAQLNEVLAHEKIQNLRPMAANSNAAQAQLKDRTDHLLSGASILRSGVATGVSVAGSAVSAGAKIAPVLAPVANVASIATGVAAIPLGLTQAGIGAAQTASNVKAMHDAGKTRDKAKATGTEFADNPTLAAIAKRIETKQDKNRIVHGMRTVGSVATTAGGLITAAGGVVNTTVGAAAGTVSFGVAPAVIGVGFGAGSAAASAVSIGATAGEKAYSIGRHFHSQARKNEVSTAMDTLRRLKSAGIDQFDMKDARIANVLNKHQKTIADVRATNIAQGPSAEELANKNPLARAAARVGDAASSAFRHVSAVVDNQIAKATAPEVGIDKTKDQSIDGQGTVLTPKGKPSVRDSIGRHSQSQVMFTAADMQAAKAMQDHAVKHRMRTLQPEIKAEAHKRAVAAANENPAKYAFDKKAMKQLEKDKLNEVTSEAKDQALAHFQDSSNLLKHCSNAMIARDSKRAVSELAGQLSNECAEALQKRGGMEIVEADLPDTPAVGLARKLGMKDKDIVKAVNAVSKPDTHKAGEDFIARKTKLR